jgi:hypothetical protein
LLREVKILLLWGSSKDGKVAMKVVLGTFARFGIEASLGRDIAAGMRTVLHHYRQRTESSRETLDFPHYSRRLLGSFGFEFDLAVDPETERVLECEAEKLDGVSVEQLAAHAVLVYLADLDRGEALGHEARPLTLL